MVLERESTAENNLYLEMNQRLLAELRASGFVARRTGDDSSGMSRVFYPAGLFVSESLSRDVYMGVKRIGNWVHDDTGFVTQLMFLQELAVISAIAKNFPNLLEQLPCVYGLVVNKDGVPLGMITEDFSEGGKFDVSRRAPAVYKVKDIFAPGTVDNDDIEKMGFNVNGGRRLGDFWPVGVISDGENARRFGQDIIEQRIGDFTLKIDYDLQ